LEAENAAVRRNLQTPLEGGETPVAHDTRLTSDAVGVTPAAALPTPNPLAIETNKLLQNGDNTPYSVFGGRGTSLMSSSVAQSPSVSVMASEASSGAAGSKAREAMVRLQVKTSLSNLPMPTNEVEVTLPADAETMTADDVQQDHIEIDMEDFELQQEAEKRHEQQIAEMKETQVIQQKLPRPTFPEVAKFNIYHRHLPEIQIDKLPKSEQQLATATSSLAEAEVISNAETRKLVLRDAIRHPMTKLSSMSLLEEDQQNEFLDFSLEELNAAKLLVALETQIVKDEHLNNSTDTDVIMSDDTAGKNDDTAGKNDIGPDVAEEVDWSSIEESFIYVPSVKRFIPFNQVSSVDKLSSLVRQFDDLKMHIQTVNKRATKMTNKLDVLTRGYRAKAQEMTKNIELLWSECCSQDTELLCFENLRRQETLSMEKRKESAREELEEEKERHGLLQARYDEFMLLERKNSIGV